MLVSDRAELVSTFLNDTVGRRAPKSMSVQNWHCCTCDAIARERKLDTDRTRVSLFPIPGHGVPLTQHSQAASDMPSRGKLTLVSNNPSRRSIDTCATSLGTACTRSGDSAATTFPFSPSRKVMTGEQRPQSQKYSGIRRFADLRLAKVSSRKSLPSCR